MYRIINSLATIEYDEKIDAVIFNFLKEGTPHLYEETLNLASSIDSINKSNIWILCKKKFEDVTPETFIKTIIRWNNNIAGGKAGKELQLFLISKECKKQLNLKYKDSLRNGYPFMGQLSLSIFSTTEEAIEETRALRERVANLG